MLCYSNVFSIPLQRFTHVVLFKEREKVEGVLHFGMRLPTLCFWSLEPRKFKRRIKDNAEVDATGGYILSRGCAEGLLCPYAHYSRISIIPTAWVSFCSVHSMGFPRTLTANRQRSDTPLSFL